VLRIEPAPSSEPFFLRMAILHLYVDGSDRKGMQTG
jgi:hypothetical protein